jgi:hypothetical protein
MTTVATNTLSDELALYTAILAGINLNSEKFVWPCQMHVYSSDDSRS